MRISHLAPVLCVIGSVGISAPSAAQPKTPPSPSVVAATDRARALHREGAALFEQKKYEDAYVAFVAAWALKRHPQIAANLADCEVKLGKYRDAAEHFTFMVRDPNGEAQPAEKQEAQRRLKEVQARIGMLVIAVDTPGADVAVDGKVVGTSPLQDPVFVEPGHHTIEARLGAQRVTGEADALAGSSRTLSLALMNAAPPGAVNSESPNRSLVIGGAIVSAAALGTGIALLALAGGEGSNGHSLHETIAQAGHSCVAGAANYDARCADLESFSSSADSLHGAGVGVLAGAGAVAAGTAMYFFWPRSSADAGARSAIRVAPAVSATNVGLLVSGSF